MGAGTNLPALFYREGINHMSASPEQMMADFQELVKANPQLRAPEPTFPVVLRDPTTGADIETKDRTFNEKIEVATIAAKERMNKHEAHVRKEARKRLRGTTPADAIEILDNVDEGDLDLWLQEESRLNEGGRPEIFKAYGKPTINQFDAPEADVTPAPKAKTKPKKETDNAK
jgi:hypothetical protein